jgi:hypothetical protein
MNISQEITFYLLQFHALHICVEFHGNLAIDIQRPPTSSGQSCYGMCKLKRAPKRWSLDNLAPKIVPKMPWLSTPKNPLIEVLIEIIHESSQQWWVKVTP